MIEDEMTDFTLLDTRGSDDGDSWDRMYYFKHKDHYFIFEDMKYPWHSHMHLIMHISESDMLEALSKGREFAVSFYYDNSELINKLIELADVLLDNGETIMEQYVAISGVDF